MASPKGSYASQIMAIVDAGNENRYFQALGKFIHEFSRVETAAHVLLAHRAGVDMKTANAVFSGFKASQVANLLNRLAEARTDIRKIEKELEEAFSHLTIINDARNDIVHDGAHIKAGDSRWVSNQRKALTRAKTTFRAVSPDILGQMTHDAARIYATLLIYSNKPEQEEMLRDIFPELTSPWQYKPDTPSPRGQGASGRKERRKSKKHQRGASQA